MGKVVKLSSLSEQECYGLPLSGWSSGLYRPLALYLEVEQKCVSLFTFCPFPACLDIQQLCSDPQFIGTRFGENEELNKLLEQGWRIENMTGVASTSFEKDDILYQVTTILVVLFRMKQPEKKGDSQEEKEVTGDGK